MLSPVALNNGDAHPGQPGAINQLHDPDADPDTLTRFAKTYFNEWRQERAERTLHINEVPSNADEWSLAEIREGLRASPLGARLLHELTQTDVALGGTSAKPITQETTLASYLYNVDTVLLRDEAPRGRKLLHAAHELRHAWQDTFGLMTNGEELHEQDYAALTFMTEADARAFAVAVAWELKQGGDSEAWDAAMGMPIYKSTAEKFEARMQSRLANAPAGTAASDADLRSAMGVAYRAWFDRASVRAPYIKTIRTTLADEHNHVWPGHGALPPRIAQTLGRLPDDPAGLRAPTYLTRSDVDLAKHHARIAFPVLVAHAATGNDPASIVMADRQSPDAEPRIAQP
ncbi:MAG: DUF6782 family putative metallopeptidase [Pseudomonadota bacterium]